eukprot:maker-scaffold_20-snap-gene-2.4-mRNA-1 protein AED:0.34 eAED:0.34 QI:127/1/1/1/0.5/0.33/3/76/402
MDQYISLTAIGEIFITLTIVSFIRCSPKISLFLLSVFSAFFVYLFNGLFPFLPSVENFHETNIGKDYVPVDTMKGAVYSTSLRPDHEVEWKEDLEIPNFSHTQVLIKVKAAGINPADFRGNYAAFPFIHYLKDYVPGKDFAGIVVAKGSSSDCSHLKKDQEVYGMTFLGSFAEYAVANCQGTYPKPTSLSFEQAAAVPLVGITAFVYLDEIPGGFQDKNILVIGGSGGCGLSVLEYLRQEQDKDKRLVSINSAKNNDIVRKMGAKEVLNYNVDDDVKAFLQDEKNQDAFDVVYGAVNSFQYFELLTPVLKPGASWHPVDMHEKTLGTILQTYLPWMNPKNIVMRIGRCLPTIERLERTSKIYGNPKSVVIQEIVDLKDKSSLWAGFASIKSRKNVGKVVFRL